MERGGAVLITGATGFIGAHLAMLLVRKGFCVAATFRNKPPEPSKRLPIPSKILWVHANDGPQWILNNTPQIIIHLATEYGKELPPSKCINSNVLFPMTLLEAACQAGCKLFLNTDSFFGKACFAYPHMRHYTFSKENFREWGVSHALNSPTRFLTLRLEHVYGEYDNADKFIPFVVDKLAVGNSPIELTDGLQRRDFIHVDDVISAYLQVMLFSDLVPKNVDEIEVGWGHSIAVREMLEVVVDITKSKATLSLGALPQRKCEIMDSSADNRELLALGWRPEVTLRQGLFRVCRAAEVMTD